MTPSPAKYVTLGFLLAAIFVAIGGCSMLLPKSVEFGQSTIHAVPKVTPAAEEKVKQGVALAAIKAREAEKIATRDDSFAAVPAGEAATLTEAVGRSLGPPKEPWKADVQALADKIDNLTAVLDRKIEKFSEKNDVNAGKKIEGTGFLQVPYFLWIGGLIVIGLIAWTALKAFLTVAAAANPGVAVGLGVAKVGGAAASKALGEVILGGEAFLKAAKDKLEPEIAEKVKELFVQHQERKQSPDTQRLIDQLTN
jgi:hypothetical protein